MPLSASTHAAIGAVSGVIEVTLLHPTVAWKNALQEGRPLNLTPKALYRGYLINVGSFAPITMVQFGVNRLLETRLSRTGDGASGEAQRAVLETLRAVAARTGSDLTGGQRIAVAAAAGAASSVVGTPCELIIIQQQVRICERAAQRFRRRVAQRPAACVPAAGIHCGRPH